MIRIFTVKPFLNKRNNQISIVLPKNKITIFKKKFPKEIKLKIEEIKW